MTHTPGPWIAERINPDGGILVEVGSQWQRGFSTIIATVWEARAETQVADARLIAAAPDLLAALQWIVDHGDTGEGGRPAFHAMRAKAREAITKATEG